MQKDIQETNEHFSGQSREDAWSLRRKTLYGALTLTMLYIIGISFLPIEMHELHSTILASLTTFVTSLTVIWIGGSVLDDKWTGEHFSGQSRKEAWDKRRLIVQLSLLFTAVYIFVISFAYDKIADIHVSVTVALISYSGTITGMWFAGSVADDKWRKKLCP